jgi:hypothetical protein
MAVTSYDFLTKYKKFQSQDLEMVELCLEQASAIVATSVWGQRRDTGVMLACAHFLEMEWSQTAETGGTAIAMASGSGGRSPQSQENDWLLTTYGRRFKYLLDGLLNGTISPALDEGEWDGQIKFGIGVAT